MSIVIDYTKGFFEAAPSGETVGDISGNATLDLSSGNVFSHTPTADTTFVFSNPPASGTAYGMTLKVTGAEAASGYDLANASYDSVSKTISGASGPVDISFKPDGTKMYILDYTTKRVYQHNLSTAWDLSTASTTANTSYLVSSQSGDPYGLRFKSDGSKMYIVDVGTSAAYQYSLSTAWDVSSASYDSVSFSFSAQEIGAWGIEFSPDGATMLMVGYAQDAVFQYSLSTPWDLSTASYTGSSLSLSAQDGSNIGMRFSGSGNSLFVSGYNNDAVYEYSLISPFSIAGASYSGTSLSLTTVAADPRGIVFKDDGLKLYVLNISNDTIYQYTTGSSAPATFTYPASVDWPSGTAPDAPAVGETDVLVFYTEDGGTTYYGFQAGGAMA